MISATILADSVSPRGIRLVTLEVNVPMVMQPQILRHRDFSFSVQSTRAVPTPVQVARVRENPFVPMRWGRVEKGMVASDVLNEVEESLARETWLLDMDRACRSAENLNEIGVHQEVAARVLMPYAWCRMIISSTQWDNFEGLRTYDPTVQGETEATGRAMIAALAGSDPKPLEPGQWHLPLVTEEEEEEWGNESPKARLVSAGRCARVSFLQHDGTRNPDRDFTLGRGLANKAHWSALEHQATPLVVEGRCGNFRDWKQQRKFYPYEDNRKAWLAAQK